MPTITKYFDHSGQQITTKWRTGPDGTRYDVANISTEQRDALSIVAVEVEIVPPPLPTLADAKAARIAAINFECRSRITAAWPLEKQTSALAGIYGQPELEAMTAFIDAHIAASNAASDAVEAATTIEAVGAVTVVWPV